MAWLRLDPPEQRAFTAFVIAFGASIMAWACLHDLHLIRTEPRHFTVYHQPLLPLTNHTLLALQYAVAATLGPGMVFGGITFAVSRLGQSPRIGLRRALAWFIPFLAAIEIASLRVGALARSRHATGAALPYPEFFYPDDTAGIAYSQSVNLTAYLAAGVFGALYLLTLTLLRRRMARVLSDL